MKTHQQKTNGLVWLTALLLLAGGPQIFAQTTGFTYQITIQHYCIIIQIYSRN